MFLRDSDSDSDNGFSDRTVTVIMVLYDGTVTVIKVLYDSRNSDSASVW